MLHAAGAVLTATSDGNLRIIAPPEVLTDATRASLRTHKAELLILLSGTCDLRSQPSYDLSTLPVRFPWAVRWARERGYLLVRDMQTGEWHEAPAAQCPDWWRDEARRAKQAAHHDDERYYHP